MSQKNNLWSYVNGIAQQMPSVNKNYANPVESLNIVDIETLQEYLEELKKKKLAKINSESRVFFPVNRANEIYNPINTQMPVDWRTTNNCGVSERAQKMKDALLDKTPSYYNPYEYGATQRQQPPLYKKVYNDPYDNDPALMNRMGVKERTNLPDHIRDINVESSLWQREMPRTRGQRNITQQESNRFNLLPFDPQNPDHIVWPSNLPRGGVSTRADKFDYDGEIKN